MGHVAGCADIGVQYWGSAGASLPIIQKSSIGDHQYYLIGDGLLVSCWRCSKVAKGALSAPSRDPKLFHVVQERIVVDSLVRVDPSNPMQRTAR
jgi:hypothetical protein